MSLIRLLWMVHMVHRVYTVHAADCILVMPLFPLSLNGLLTPYRLQSVNLADPCLMNPATATFVEATILDVDTRRISVYHPLVINDGTTPLFPPTPFTLPPNSIVSLSFGTNANTLRLTPLESMKAGKCVNGISGGDLFGQFAYCNSDLLFDKVEEWTAMGIDLIPPIPPIGMANDGKECLTTRHFMMVDQDPSDNVVTTYLLDPVTMKVMQDTPNARLAHPTFLILKNGSDNRLLVTLNVAMQCTGYMAPLLTDAGASLSASLVLNEIHATYRQAAPMVRIPSRDPMTRILVNGQAVPSLIKNNLYRKGIHQPQLTTMQQADTVPFCGHFINQIGRLQANKALFSTQLSPDGAASTLFTFLANRFFQSYQNLKCDMLLDIINPVTLVMSNGIVTDATFAVVEEYQFLGQDPYSNGTPMPTSAPTAAPTDAPMLPTMTPTAPIMPGGMMIVYIVFGSLTLLILLVCVWKRYSVQAPLLVVPPMEPVVAPVYRQLSVDSPRTKPISHPISLPRIKS